MKCIAETAQGRFLVDSDDQFVSRSLLAGSYGLQEIERARSFLHAGSRVLVAGAHVGAIAIPLSRYCREVVALEPNPSTYVSLETNVQLNRCTNVTTYPVAANDKNETLTFVMNTRNSGGSKRMPKERRSMYFDDDPKLVEVAGVRLDDFLQSDDFDLVFMDIEGSESFAFRGMPRILARAATLIVEFVPHHLTCVAGVTVEEFLESLLPHFDRLTVPSSGIECTRDSFVPVLTAMFAAGRSDDGIVFRKSDV